LFVKSFCSIGSKVIELTDLFAVESRATCPAQAATMNESSSDIAPVTGLDPVESEFIRFFVQIATTLNLPRSIGEIFGFLFAADEPRPFNEVVARLGISKGSASHGLKFLVKIGAISQVYVPRDRRTFYEAETKMRTLFSNALNESVRPHLEGNARLIGGIETCIDEQAEELGSKADHYRNRAASLKGWTDKSLLLLPLLDKLFSLPAPLFPFNLFGGESAPESGKSPTPPAPGHA
jgi:DNA-binding transcriptional regulator GbsR (MarR family)